MDTQGLRLDQAPPLALPAAFFLCLPLFLGAAALLLILGGGDALQKSWRPLTIALAHLGTLGLLGSVMLGALYQMIPVVAGSPVPLIRLAGATWASWIVGVGAFTAGLALGLPDLVSLGRASLGLAVLLFALPVGFALLRSRAELEIRLGFGLAIASLVGLASLGIGMANGHTGGAFLVSRPEALIAHLALGAFGWVGALISTVSWQVLPMFYLAPAVGQGWRRLVLAGLTLGAWAPLLGLTLGLGRGWLVVLALPGAAVAWGLHPVLVLWSIRRRSRARRDPSLGAWQASMSMALTGIPLAGLAALTDSTRPAMVLGWLLIWGHGALLIHGMLSRILPFLVWFHRWSGRVGKERVPSMRSLLPDALVEGSLGMHGVALLLGVGAAASGNDALARLTGVGLLGSAAMVGRMMRRVLGGWGGGG